MQSVLWPICVLRFSFLYNMFGRRSRCPADIRLHCYLLPEDEREEPELIPLPEEPVLKLRSEEPELKLLRDVERVVVPMLDLLLDERPLLVKEDDWRRVEELDMVPVLGRLLDELPVL